MADVTSTATLQIVTKGQESIDALKSSLDSLKSTGEELRSAQFLDPAALRENVNAQVQATRQMEFAARGFGDETENAQRTLESFGRSDAMKQAQQAFVGAQKNLREVEAAGGDVETAMKGVKDAGEAYNTVVRAERDQRREIGRQLIEQEAQQQAVTKAGVSVPQVPGAPPGVPAAAAPAAAVGWADAAGVAAAALSGLALAAGVAKGAMEVFGQANVVAAEASRKVIETAALAQKAGIDYEQAAAERAAGAGLFGEKGMADIQKRFARNLREGGKQLQADLETIGLRPEEAPPTPVEFARRAAARRAQLQEAITRGDEGAQAAMNEFQSAMTRRAGPAMSRVVNELTDKEISDRAAGAEKISNAFTSDIAPKQLRDQSVAFEKSQAEQTQAHKGFWDQLGEAATPGLTKYNEAVTQGLVEGGPSAAQAAGKFAGWFAGKTGEYLQGKAAQWQAYQDIGSALVEGVKGAVSLVTPTPAAAAELAPAVAAAAPPAEPVPIKPDLSEVKAAVEAEPLKPDVSQLQQAVQESEIKMPDISALQDAMASLQAIDLSGVASQITAAGSELGSTAAAGITEAGSSGGQAFSSAAQSGITEAGSSGGQAFASAAQSGITAAGSAGGAAFAAAINPGAIGSAIGSAAAAAISAAKVNVNVNVAGAAGGGASTGKDSAT